MIKKLFYAWLFLMPGAACLAQPGTAANKKISVIAYYAGDARSIDQYPVEKLTHLIFSFCHLKGNRLNVDNAKDSATIKHLVELKKRNPQLKIILSLGGWSGCETCSAVFADNTGRNEFAASVKELNDYFHTDGIDLDWEYPVIEGYPGHLYQAADKENFTSLIKALRTALGRKPEISFAAGGFQSYLKQSIDWAKVVPMVDKINLMTYDLVNGYSRVTGHHTPLYSTPQQNESTDAAVKYLLSINVPADKLVIGAAFYGRLFDTDSDGGNGLYQSGKFNHGISYKDLDLAGLGNEGFTAYWDDTAQAPWLFAAQKKQQFTYDNERSVMLKTKYAISHRLNGIMFWQLGDDKPVNGLLDAIDKAVQEQDK
ncbi:MAG TPA: glycoside hydrolase family 18 protein [Panacibacter sp.]|nr:glycoside hydrolase family 18 protein [Panacibacter sp.]HNP44480.1 glycoside hydrolase family 18 protein [Panacibacter sp.]